jgi:predicted MFS family arabinose efflux permease
MIAIWGWVKAQAVVIGAGAIAVLYAILRIRKSGRDSERAANLEATLKAVQKKEGVKREIDRMPDSAAADRLRDKWSRD